MIVDEYFFYRINIEGLYLERYFILVSFFSFNSSSMGSEYFLFSNAKKELLFAYKAAIRTNNNTAFKEKESFKRFIKEKIEDDTFNILKEHNIKAFSIEEANIDEYIIFLNKHCKEIVKEIKNKSNSDKLKDKLWKIENLGLIYEEFDY